MSNTKNVNAKKIVTTAKKVVVKGTAKVENLQKINLSKFADVLSKVEDKAIRGVKDALYIYPADFTQDTINSLKGKQFRNQQRNKLDRFADNISLFAKHNRIEDFVKECENFKLFYKEIYRLNDFSVSSLSQSAKDAKKDKLTLLLNLVKETN